VANAEGAGARGEARPWEARATLGERRQLRATKAAAGEAAEEAAVETTDALKPPEGLADSNQA
jgi:hypothetical protein